MQAAHDPLYISTVQRHGQLTLKAWEEKTIPASCLALSTEAYTEIWQAKAAAAKLRSACPPELVSPEKEARQLTEQFEPGLPR